MRLGQLARKYNLKQEQIIEFLNNHNPGLGPYHSNTKLSDHTEDLIAEHFNKSFADLSDNEAQETADSEDYLDNDVKDTTNLPTELTDNPPETSFEADIQGELDPSLPVVDESAYQPLEEDKSETKHKAIETDKLIEMLESEAEDVDLSDITLIKAPKKELEGLKVIGKIDLPEPKPKKEDKALENETETEGVQKRKRRPKRNELSPEEKEERRLRAKRKKEAYEARQEKKRQEEEARRLKERKKAHYEQKIKKSKAPQVNKRSSTEKIREPEVEPIHQEKRPKTALGRFWAWFWHGKKY